MIDEHELTVRIAETETGEYRTLVVEAPERHFATGEDPMVTARGALGVAPEAVYAAVDDDRRAALERPVSE